MVLGGAIAAGFSIDFSKLWKKVAGTAELDARTFEEVIAAENQLVVVNMMVDGDPNAAALKAILGDIEKEQVFGNQVGFAELVVASRPELSDAQQVDVRNFSGQLNFYAAGRRLGTMKGPADRQQVEETIQRYLAGLVKRFGRGWLPPVEGMSRASDGSGILKVRPADPSNPQVK